MLMPERVSDCSVTPKSENFQLFHVTFSEMMMSALYRPTR